MVRHDLPILPAVETADKWDFIEVRFNGMKANVIWGYPKMLSVVVEAKGENRPSGRDRNPLTPPAQIGDGRRDDLAPEIEVPKLAPAVDIQCKKSVTAAAEDDTAGRR
jgi:hypothetical protein